MTPIQEGESAAAAGPRESLRLWALAALAEAVAWAAWEVLVARPGLGAPEELANFALAVDPGATWRFWLRLGGGAWSRALQSLLLAPGGPWQSLYGFNLLALAGCAWGLWRLARFLDGEAAAAFSLLLCFSAPFTFLQARTTFSYVLVPAWILGLVLGLRGRRGAAASALLGLLAALAWLDYEAWGLALPALALAWATAPPGSRARARPLAAGFLAGCGLLLAAEAPYLRDWLFERGRGGGFTGAAPALWMNLRGYAFGSRLHPALGLEDVPTVPPLAWPGLVAGVWAAPLWLWAWAFFGLLGLWAGGPFMEPNRAIVAWPALLLIAGMGTAWWGKRLPRRPSRLWLGLALVLAPAIGSRGFVRAERAWDASIEGPSREVFRMAAFLKDRSRTRSLVLGPALEFQDTPLLERCLGRPTGPPTPGAAVETWFLVPRTLADPADPRWGRWAAFNAPNDPHPLYLLRASGPALALLGRTARDLADEEAVLALPGPARLRALDGRVAEAATAWSESVWAGLRLREALALGRVTVPDVTAPLEGPCLDSAPLEAIQGAFGRLEPGLAALAKARENALARPGARWVLAFPQRPR